MGARATPVRSSSFSACVPEPRSSFVLLMSLHETILVSTAPPISHASLGAGSLAVYDIQTGAALASFKQTSASTRSVAALETRDGIGGVMFAAQTEKAVLNVYTFQKVGCVSRSRTQPSL